MEMDETLDRQLVGRFLADGDEHAFRRLYRRHSPSLYGLLLRLLGGREAVAQDLLQETWLRASRSLGGFRWRSGLRTWLRGIAVNCARETFREQPGESAEPLKEEDPFFTPDLPPSIHRLDWQKALAALPDGYRQVVVLFDVEGYSHEEIGHLLEIAPGTSKSQLARGRRALRTWFATEGTSP